MTAHFHARARAPPGGVVALSGVLPPPRCAPPEVRALAAETRPQAGIAREGHPEDERPAHPRQAPSLRGDPPRARRSQKRGVGVCDPGGILVAYPKAAWPLSDCAERPNLGSMGSEDDDGDFPRFDRLTYVMCPDCNRVFHDPEFKLHAYETEPCPHCGAFSIRSAWPGFGLGDFDIVDPRVKEPRALPPIVLPDGSTVIEFPVATREDVTIACVFLCAALEAILQDSLRWTVERFGTPAPVTDALMARSRQRDGLLNLYRDLVGRGAKDVLQTRDGQLGKWFDDWRTVAGARNRIGHGARRPLPDPRVVRNVRDGTFLAIATLHNEAMDAADAYTAANPRHSPPAVDRSLG